MTTLETNELLFSLVFALSVLISSLRSQYLAWQKPTQVKYWGSEMDDKTRHIHIIGIKIVGPFASLITVIAIIVIVAELLGISPPQ